ncbi:hypothetical protein FACS1894107_03730 [Planctomycetales bacterium]|nr:hypothetical protein FACS1894107_03730 [Planctomycetales bacterium]GHV23182.1 hypothetical protein AGMMS49959_15500 [Planctomycetales bacterium]
MPRAYVLLNHQLTDRQIAELRDDFGAVEIMPAPENLAAQWASIPTDRELTAAMLAPFIDWLNAAAPADVVVIQGEFGAVFALVDYALRRGLLPLHSVTKRVAHETRDGEIVRRSYVFEHVLFRRYRDYAALTFL